MMMKYFGLIFLSFALLPRAGRGQRELVLSSDPDPIPTCPVLVVFTCRTTSVGTFLWTQNGDAIAIYTLGSGRPGFYELAMPSQIPGVSTTIENITLVPGSNSIFDINSTLTVEAASISTFNVSTTIRCQDMDEVSNGLLINGMGSPTPPVTCSLSSSPNGGTHQFSLSFHDRVERYNVTVTPDPSTCSSDQVSPSEDYSCSGLDLGFVYFITASAIDCRNLTETFNFSVQLAVPQIPDHFRIRSEGDTLRIEWQEVNAPPISSGCTFEDTVNYTIVLLDLSGQTVKEEVVTSGNCSAGLCSITVPTSDQYCRVTVTTSNEFTTKNEFGKPSSLSTTLSTVRFTTSNLVLLGIGVAVLCLAVIFCVVLTHLERVTDKGSWLSLMLLFCGVMLIVVSVVLWVAVGCQVGLQDDLCDSVWVSTRDRLIVAAFVISTLAFLVSVTVTGLFLICIKCKENIQQSNQKFSKLLRPRKRAAPDSNILEFDVDPNSKQSKYAVTEHTEESTQAKRNKEGKNEEYSVLGKSKHDEQEKNEECSVPQHGKAKRDKEGKNKEYSVLGKSKHDEQEKNEECSVLQHGKAKRDKKGKTTVHQLQNADVHVDTTANLITASKDEVEVRYDHKLTFDVTKADSLLEWEFSSTHYDVGFGVYFLDGDEEREVVPVKRYDSHLKLQEGRCLCSSIGNYTAVFDNKYSKIRYKYVSYSIKVIPP